MIAETYSTRRCLETHHQLGCDRRNRELATANHVGPLLLPVTVATLVTLIILGYALLYWPHLPAGFNVDEKAQSARGIEALYFSGITFTTLGYGDIAPRSTPMRLLALSEALTPALASSPWPLATWSP
jgi:hypothetical protein